MAKAKTKSDTKKTSSKELITTLNDALMSLANEADENNPDHRASLLKLEATIKFIQSRW